MTVLRVASFVMVAASVAGCGTFMVAYHRWYPWWKSGTGRHLFAFIAALGALDTVFLVSIIARPSWASVLRVVLVLAYLPQPFLVWWRVALLTRTHRKSHDTSGEPMATPAPLVTAGWWRLLLERVGRQAVQTVLPIDAAVMSSGGHVDLRTVTVGLAGALAVTVGKAAILWFAGIQVPADASLTARILDRAVPAFAGVLAGLWPVDAAGLAAIQWGPALTAATSAALIAVAAIWVTPPTLTPAPARRGRRTA